MTTTATIKVGDRVVVDHPKATGTYVVVKVNPRRYVLRPESDGNHVARTVNADHELVRPVGSAPVVTEVPLPESRTLPTQHPGSFLRYVGPASRKRGAPVPGEIFVVIADKWDRINSARPGGDGGTYWRLSARNVEAVPLDDAILALYVAAAGD